MAERLCSKVVGGQWIDARNGHSFSDWTFTQGIKIIGKKPMFKSCGLGGQWIDARNGHSFSDWTFTQGLKIIGKKPHAFVFCTLVPLNRS